VEGPFKVNRGGWTLKPLENGEKTEATYDVEVEVGFLVPKKISNMLVGQSLPDTLRRFKERAEEIAAEQGA
jgi:ribosome-associated toxin RatA of RatAB toxin-antitoxin module